MNNLEYQAAMVSVLQRLVKLSHEASPLLPSAALDREAKLDAWADKQIDARLSKTTGAWDSTEEIEAKRAKIAKQVYDSPAFTAKYAEVHAPPPVAQNAPLLKAVELGVLSKAETDADPQGALQRLTSVEIYRTGRSRAEVTADFYQNPDSIGYDLMRVADRERHESP